MTVLLGLGVAGLTVVAATVGILGCRGHGLRSWVVHGGVTAVMVGMLLPLPSVGAATPSLVSSAALLALMLWTTVAGRRGRSSPARRLNSLRELTDLSAMSLLVVVMPSSTVDSGTSVIASVAAHAHHVGTPAPAGSVTGLILVLWLAALVVGGLRAFHMGRHASPSSVHGIAGSALMLAGMTAMTVIASTM